VQISCIKGFLSKLDCFATKGYTFAFKIENARPMLFHSTYDPRWVQEYGEMNALLFDPSVAWCWVNEGIIRWSEIDIPDSLGVGIKAKKYDLNYGASMSVGPITSRSLGGISRADREFADSELESAFAIFTEMHDLLESKKFKKIHIETLECYASGLSFGDIVKYLEISRTALTSRMKQIRKKLNVNSNVEAVRVASERGMLRGDLLAEIREHKG
jgi:LuxR family transcriptional regulator